MSRKSKKALAREVVDEAIKNYDYSPRVLLVHPYQLFRMELLKILKYPEISYRKYCTNEYFGMERKQNRKYVRLPLNTKTMVDHTELSHFKTGLHFRQVAESGVLSLSIIFEIH